VKRLWFLSSTSSDNGGLDLTLIARKPPTVSANCVLGTPPVSTDPTCELIVFDNATVTVTATFTATKPTSFALTVINENTGYGGTGTVTSQPSGITSGGSCVASFPSATSVTLTATPATNSYFDGWTNCDSVKGETCTVSMDRARLVKALFGYP
jgi:hypothetical protein